MRSWLRHSSRNKRWRSWVRSGTGVAGLAMLEWMVTSAATASLGSHASRPAPVNNRHKRRAELARFRRETGGVLLTWLVDAHDPSLQKESPILVHAAHRWCENLPAAPRHCICCLSLIWDRREVGELLLSMPVNSTS